MIHMINNVKLLNIPDRYFMTVYRSIKTNYQKIVKDLLVLLELTAINIGNLRI